MKVEITITHAELLRIVAEHVSDKTGSLVVTNDVKLYVKSKNNYRLKTWEDAAVIVTTKPPVEGSKPMDAETEIKAEVVVEN